MDYVIGLAIFLGFLTGSLLLFFSVPGKSINTLLALSLFLLSFMSLTSYLNASGYILEFPHAMRTGNIAAYLAFPIIYLFYKRAITGDLIWKSWYWLFVIPAAFYLMDFSTFFMLDASTKIDIFSQKVGNSEALLGINEGFIGIEGFHLVFRTIWGSYFLILIGKILWINQFQFLKGSKREQNFFKVLSFIWIVFCLLLLIPGILNLFINLKVYTVGFISISLTGVILFISLILLFYPQLLYGYYWTYKTEIEVLKAVNTNIDETEAKKEEHKLMDNFNQREKGLYELLKTHVEKHMSFQQVGYTIHMLSQETGIPAYKISSLINSISKNNFNNWINSFRTDYFIRLVEDGDVEKYTLDSLAQKCGFSNRGTFTSAFKKSYGSTPGKYIREFSVIKTQ